MKRTTFRRVGAAAAITLSLTAGLAACSEEEDTTASEDTSSETTEEEPMDEEMDMDDPAAQTYGPGCQAVPEDGDGSFVGMATDPVATAASNNPLLETLVTAVGAAELVDTLNSAEALTVFAPTNDAFAAIPPADLEAVLADKELLTSILTYHVVGEQIAPDALSGELETLNGATLTINGEGEAATVGTEEAQVLCGNIPTANATVYVIDTVLMPPA